LAPVLGKASETLAKSGGCSSAPAEGAGSMAAGAKSRATVRPGRSNLARGARGGPRLRPRRRGLQGPRRRLCARPAAASPPGPARPAASARKPGPQRSEPPAAAGSSDAPAAHHVARRRPPVCARDRGRTLHHRPGARPPPPGLSPLASSAAPAAWGFRAPPPQPGRGARPLATAVCVRIPPPACARHQPAQ
jgi:hypothetical protein